MKRIISLILCALLAFSCMTLAFAKDEESTPVILVSGMGAFPLYDMDTSETAFPPSAETIVKSVLGVAPSLSASALLNKWDILGKYGMEPIHGLFEKLKCDENGDSVYNVSATVFTENVGNYEVFKDDESTKSTEKGVIRAIAEKIGWDRAYFFYFDFRRSALDIADDLKVMIDKVLEETGSEKVSLVAMSFGGTVATSYFYKYGTEKLHNVVFASTAVFGTDIVGKLFTGNIEIEIDAVLNCIEEHLIKSDFAYELFGLGKDVIKKYGKSAKKAIDAYLRAMIEKLKEPVYAKVFMDTFVRFPGIWGLMNCEYYEEAKKQMIPYASLSDSFIAKTDEYAYNVGMKAQELIEKAESSGVNVYFTGAYGYAGIPLTESACNHTDSLIDTYLMTGYAEVADYGKTLDSSSCLRESVCTNKSHNHISTDKVIDASVCILPEKTWFIKNMSHVEYGREQDSGRLLVWLSTSEEPVDVRTNPLYPQFLSLDRSSGKCTSLTEGAEIPLETQQKSFLEKLDDWFGRMLAFIRAFFFKAV